MHVENFLSQNCNISSVLGIFKYNSEKVKQIINLLLLNNFYPVIYRRIQKESDELLYTVWSLVMVRARVASARG